MNAEKVVTVNNIQDVKREQVEDFLFFEAELLDEWLLMEWSDLFSERGAYAVPTMNNASEDYNSTLYIIADPYFRIKERAKRLLKKETHIEYPHSKTRHMVTNVRIQGVEDDAMSVACNFMVSRTKRGVLDTYVGHYKYKLVCENGNIKILEKRVILDMDYLRPHGKVSIIL
ncbi:aromatic-ring-hydroxylating dioxygenase subunit beta [Paenibacillus beijingensis]|uniref:p-cumate dioxygenase n=1 Tax=Paenibacillus beijingensis TaxID=1126833 RepID=A0A0D5NGW8_9BACL|nr:aromatic-ring-hydroxylating dioxygenase subunit beta [Paenibacillus beijingensis]AJY74153.1 hypothetical protein VN24_05635 [Paenibacillus beijingensis]